MIGRRLIVVAAVAAAGLVAAPGDALAAITGSAVTTPTDPYVGSFDFRGDMGPFSVHVAGMTSGAVAGDTVDLRCYRDNPTSSSPAANYSTLKAGVALQADGSFNAYVPQDTLRVLCRIRAVPAGTAPLDLTPFAGPRAYNSELDAIIRVKTAGRAEAGVPEDFYYSALSPSRDGFMDFNSLGGCGLDDAFVLDPGSDVQGRAPFFCNAYLYYRDGSASSAPGTRSELQIDGHNAYNSSSANQLVRDLLDPSTTGVPPLTATVNRDPATGLLTIDESQNIVRCPADDFPQTSTSCPSFVATGVRALRHIVMRSGRVVDFTDTWVSTDGAAHHVDTLYENDVDGTQAAFNFPWADGSTYSTHVGGDTKGPAPGAGPTSIFLKTDPAAPDGSLASPQGAITTSQPPQSARFIAPAVGDPSQAFLLGFSHEITAGSSWTLKQTFADGITTSEVQAAAARAVDRQVPPKVTISGPANGTRTSNPSITVTGLAIDNVGVSSLTVGGAATPLGAGGSFRHTVNLVPGTNTISVVAHDAQSSAGLASVSVIYTPKAKCVVPKLTGDTASAAVKALRAAHCAVGRTHKVTVKLPSRKSHRRSQVGRVLRSSPGARKVLPSGARVDLYVGAAPKRKP